MKLKFKDLSVALVASNVINSELLMEGAVTVGTRV